DERRLDRATVLELYTSLLRTIDHVLVGQDISIARHDHARPEPTLPKRLRRPRAGELIAEEATEQVVLLTESSRGHPRSTFGVNGNDGRRDDFDNVRIRIARRGHRADDAPAASRRGGEGRC